MTWVFRGCFCRLAATAYYGADLQQLKNHVGDFRFHCRLASVDELEPRLLLLQQGNLSQRAVLDSSDTWNHVGDLRALNADMQQLMSWNFAFPYSSVEISLRVPIFGVFPTSPTRSITSVPPIQKKIQASMEAMSGRCVFC